MTLPLRSGQVRESINEPKRQSNPLRPFRLLPFAVLGHSSSRNPKRSRVRASWYLFGLKSDYNFSSLLAAHALVCMFSHEVRSRQDVRCRRRQPLQLPREERAMSVLGRAVRRPLHLRNDTIRYDVTTIPSRGDIRCCPSSC